MQFYYSDDSTLMHIRNVTLTTVLNTVNEIHISDDGEFYYGLTNQNVRSILTSLRQTSKRFAGI